MRMRTLGMLFGSALLIVACGGGSSEESTTKSAETGQEDTATTAVEDTSSTEEEMTTTTSGKPSTSEAEMMEGVHLADSSLGEILVDPDGFTLYIFTADSGGESSCYDACADLWPPVPADTAISSDLDQSMFGTTSRTDGTEQLTVNDMPLYLYTPDTSPGDLTGQGFNGVWFVVDGEASIIEAAASNDAVIDYGY